MTRPGLPRLPLTQAQTATVIERLTTLEAL